MFSKLYYKSLQGKIKYWQSCIFFFSFWGFTAPAFFFLIRSTKYVLLCDSIWYYVCVYQKLWKCGHLEVLFHLPLIPFYSFRLSLWVFVGPCVTTLLSLLSLYPILTVYLINLFLIIYFLSFFNILSCSIKENLYLFRFGTIPNCAAGI